MIRKATISDFPQFTKLVQRFRAELATYPNCPVDPLSITQVFGRCVNDARRLALVVDHDGELTGALLAVTQELWWSKTKEATDIMIYSERGGDGVGLIRRYVGWAHRLPNIAVITVAHSSGVGMDRIEALYEQLGLAKIGSLHQMVIHKIAKEEAA